MDFSTWQKYKGISENGWKHKCWKRIDKIHDNIANYWFLLIIPSIFLFFLYNLLSHDSLLTKFYKILVNIPVIILVTPVDSIITANYIILPLKAKATFYPCTSCNPTTTFQALFLGPIFIYPFLAGIKHFSTVVLFSPWKKVKTHSSSSSSTERKHTASPSTMNSSSSSRKARGR